VLDLDRLEALTSESGCTKTNRPYLIGWNETVEQFFIFRPDCKCWNCPACAARLQARWKQRAYLGIKSYIEAGYDFKFVTLTSHERLYSFSQTMRVWPHACSMLRKRVQYIYQDWYWVMIPEQHKNGRLHVHMISSASLGQRWWKDNARACGLGWRAEEAEFKGDASDPARASAYAGKYMAKQMTVNAWPRYFHHIRTSQHFPELPEPENNPYADIDWVALTPKQIVNWLAYRQRENQPVYYTGNGELLS